MQFEIFSAPPKPTGLGFGQPEQIYDQDRIRWKYTITWQVSDRQLTGVPPQLGEV